MFSQLLGVTKNVSMFVLLCVSTYFENLTRRVPPFPPCASLFCLNSILSFLSVLTTKCRNSHVLREHISSLALRITLSVQYFSKFYLFLVTGGASGSSRRPLASAAPASNGH